MKLLKCYIFKIELIKLKIQNRFKMHLLSTKFNVTKFFLVLASVFFISLGLVSPAKADTKEASSFVSDLAARVIDLVKRADLDEATKESKLNDIFLKSVDTKWIGKFSLGQYWRSITPPQQDQFLNLYSKYLTGMYVPNFRKYTGNVVKVTGAKELRANEYLVQTVIVDPINSAGNIQINYMLRQDPAGLEKFVIFDVIAEGVSLITTQRAELGSVMANQGFDSMMSLLKRKTSGDS